MQWDVGIIEIQHDLARHTRMRFEEQIDQQRIDLRSVAIDLVILRRMAPGRVLQAIERTLASQRLTVTPQHRAQLARQHCKGWVLAQFVMIVEILISQRQAEDALSHQRVDLMLDIAWVAPIDEAVGEATHQPKVSVNLAQQQRPCIGGNVPTIETGHHRTPFNRFKFQQLRRTLCLHRGTPGIVEKLLLHNDFLKFSAPMHRPRMRNRG